MTQQINYGALMHKALRRLMAEVLSDVGENGLPGEHHFFITVDTMHPDLEMPGHLRAQYPEEMTIVIQNWFENLIVGDDGFQITLSFSNKATPLSIPFDAVKTFVDPSVEFGLRFDAQQDEDTIHVADEVVESEEPTPEPQPDGEVVSLDSFRK